jgi:hypothetical protein
MVKTGETVNLDYDAENDVLWALAEKPDTETIAIPGGPITVLVSGNLDRVVGLVFEHYASMLQKSRPDLKALPGPVVFESSKDLLEPVVDSMIRSFGPIAKDRVARWLELTR